MAYPLIQQLPVELLRKIFTQLPCSTTALAFIRTCRSIHAACNDWTAWRDLVATQETLARYYRTLKLRSTDQDQDVWRRWVVADALAVAARRDICVGSEEVERWLLGLVVLHHPVLLSINIPSLHRLCDTICNVPIVSGPDADPLAQADTAFPISPSRTADTHTWRLAQAASFCVTARLLASPPPPDGDKPPCLLPSVQWFCLTNLHGQSVSSEDTTHRLVMLHTLANRAVGFFYQGLCWALANNRLCGPTSSSGLMHPPTTFSLPLPALCAPPVPFTSHALEHFSTCHLAAMTSPAFFIDDDWTGYFSTGPGPGPAMHFDGVGGDNVDVSVNRLDQLPNTEFPFAIERVIRFHLVQEWNDGNKFLLQSNGFQSQAWLHMLRVTVDRATGHLQIAHNHLRGGPWGVVDAVITPFGIVEAVGPGGFWRWFWKCKWSQAKA